MGQYELAERNENGERFANLCAFNKLIIGGTIFPHKATWVSPDHTTENQIDHIYISKKSAREGNMRQLYDATKKLVRKYSKPERPVKDKEDSPITEIQGQEVMKTSTSDGSHSIQWTARNHLEESDFA
ncbi:unnamed protein product, partial [Schistosoma curassoni]|uniref:Uncharacterized protein n=1 Tax=Schistosoma curassoni TaxID=6186 RepID=A0A183JL60_9TREM